MTASPFRKTAPAGSLQVLDLFAEGLDEGLEVDDGGGDLRVVRLGADGVRLAVHLLREEVELAAGGLGRGEERGGVVEVRGEARELLRHVAAVGEERDLASERGVVRRERRAELGDAAREGVG